MFDAVKQEATDGPQSVELERGAGLEWTSHPLVDMGIATLVAFSARERPEQVTRGELEAFAEFTQRALKVASVRSHASVLFTVNVPYLQPSFPKERQAANATELLHSFERPFPAEHALCTYCGRPALRLGTESGRAYRELIPLITGQGVVNFVPYGLHGLSLCGLCVLALQALVIGAPNSEGRALIVSADEPEQLVALIRAWLPDLKKRIQLSEISGAKVDTWKAPRTRLVERLVDLERNDRLSGHSSGFTVYHASNSGQGPSLDIYTLSAPAVAFARRAQAAAYHQAWQALTARAWRDAKYKVASREPTDEERPSWHNPFYESLFRLPSGAAAFVRVWLRKPQAAVLKTSLAGDYVAMWSLTELFLEEVLGMDQRRIDAIRRLGDALAQEIVGNNDRPLGRRVVQAMRYPTVRQLLLGVSARRLKRGETPILGFDEFLLVFEEGEDLPRRDWRLAWDLTLIRLTDQLYHQWHGKHDEALQDLASVGQEKLEDNDDEMLPSGVRSDE